MRDPLPWMEDIGTDIMDRVLAAREVYDPSPYTESDVRRAMCAEPSVEGFAALLSPAAEPLLEEIAARAREVTRAHFGNSVCTVASLMIFFSWMSPSQGLTAAPAARPSAIFWTGLKDASSS